MPILPLIALIVFCVLWTRETLYKSERTPVSETSDEPLMTLSTDEDKVEDILRVYLLKKYLSKDKSSKQ